MNEDNQLFVEQFQLLIMMVFNLFLMFSITIEVFLRRKFGERYFSGLVLLFSTAIVFSFATSSSFIFFLKSSGGGKANDTMAMVIAAFAYLGVGLFHQVSIYRRSKRGEWWHSRCGGISWGIWSKIFRCGEDKVQMYIEPIFCAALSFAVLPISKTLSSWILVASISLLVKGRLEYMQARKRFLDAMDAQIESEGLNAALVDRKSASEVSGFSVIGVDSQPIELRKKMVNHFSGLDKGLKDIMDDGQKVKAVSGGTS